MPITPGAPPDYPQILVAVLAGKAFADTAFPADWADAYDAVVTDIESFKAQYPGAVAMIPN